MKVALLQHVLFYIRVFQVRFVCAAASGKRVQSGPTAARAAALSRSSPSSPLEQALMNANDDVPGLLAAANSFFQQYEFSISTLLFPPVTWKTSSSHCGESCASLEELIKDKNLDFWASVSIFAARIFQKTLKPLGSRERLGGMDRLDVNQLQP